MVCEDLVHMNMVHVNIVHMDMAYMDVSRKAMGMCPDHAASHPEPLSEAMPCSIPILPFLSSIPQSQPICRTHHGVPGSEAGAQAGPCYTTQIRMARVVLDTIV